MRLTILWDLFSHNPEKNEDAYLTSVFSCTSLNRSSSKTEMEEMNFYLKIEKQKLIGSKITQNGFTFTVAEAKPVHFEINRMDPYL